MRPCGELGGWSEMLGPYDLSMKGNNRPVGPFPQGYPGFLKEKLDLFGFTMPHSLVLVTRSPTTQLQARRAIAPMKTLPVQFVYYFNTAVPGGGLRSLIFLQHLQCNTSLGGGEFHAARDVEAKGKARRRVDGGRRGEADGIKGSANVDSGGLHAVVPACAMCHYEYAFNMGEVDAGKIIFGRFDCAAYHATRESRRYVT